MYVGRSNDVLKLPHLGHDVSISRGAAGHPEPPPCLRHSVLVGICFILLSLDILLIHRAEKFQFCFMAPLNRLPKLMAYVIFTQIGTYVSCAVGSVVVYVLEI